MEGGKININYLSKFLLILLCCICSACLSEIELDIPENTAKNIVIVSKLTKGNPSTIEVKITGLSSFIGFDQPILIEDAIVTLTDESNNVIDIPYVKLGQYITTVESMPIETGSSYRLNVTANGKNYVSDFETLYPVPKATTITTQEIVRQELNNFGNAIDVSYVQFLLDSPLIAQNANSKSYIRWEFQGEYRFMESVLDLPFPPNATTCYYYQLLNNQNIAVFNGPESRENALVKEFLLEEKIDYRFHSGFYLTVLQQSLSENAYTYWDRISSITDLDGNFFEDPPGKVLGNMKNADDPNEEVFGYFYATEIDTFRYHVKRNTYNTRAFCPSLVAPNNPDIDALCYDCLKRANSTDIKPSYWIE